MTEVVRLALLSHGMTDAMSAGRFPDDEPLNGLGRRQACAVTDLGPVERALCGPERRTRQTAELLGLSAEPDPALADLNHGRWAAMPLERVDPAELAGWLTDPGSAPHGGESVVDLVGRVGDWLASLTGAPGRIIAVTHPAVVRAAVLVALGAPPNAFWRIDVEPVGRTVLHHRAQGWTLRLR